MEWHAAPAPPDPPKDYVGGGMDALPSAQSWGVNVGDVAVNRKMVPNNGHMYGGFTANIPMGSGMA